MKAERAVLFCVKTVHKITYVTFVFC